MMWVELESPTLWETLTQPKHIERWMPRARSFEVTAESQGAGEFAGTTEFTVELATASLVLLSGSIERSMLDDFLVVTFRFDQQGQTKVPEFYRREHQYSLQAEAGGTFLASVTSGPSAAPRFEQCRQDDWVLDDIAREALESAHESPERESTIDLPKSSTDSIDRGGLDAEDATRSRSGTVGATSLPPSSATGALDLAGPNETRSEDAEHDSSALLDFRIPDAEVRTALQNWASGKLLVDAESFNGPLVIHPEIRTESAITRLVEVRSEAWSFVPASQQVPAHPRYSFGLDTIVVAEPFDFSSKRWDFIGEGSEDHRPCPAGCSHGHVNCPRCQGGTVRCFRCFGSGQKRTTEMVNGRQVERSERCYGCAGSGRVPCSNCRGSGSVQCSECQGAGTVIWFVLGTITHEPETVTVSEGVPPGINPKKVAQAEWTRVSTTPGLAAPSMLPKSIGVKVDAELARRPGGELLRKLETAVLPVATVEVAEYPDAVVTVLGVSRLVFASGMRSRQRSLRLVAALAVLAVSIGLLVLVFGIA